MKQFIPFLLILSLFISTQIIAQQTEIIYLSGIDSDNTVEWEFYCTDGRRSGEWTNIEVPSNWELQGFGTYNYGHDWRIKDKKLGKEHGLYRHKFNVPAGWKGKAINIVFDGSMTDTQVKINGRLAGEIHQGGFYRFKYDISKLLRYGQENLLEVDVAKHSANQSVNEAERQADFWIFGGIFRPVFLEVLPAVHISRAAIDAQADGSFNVQVEVNDSRRPSNVTVELFDLDGKKIPGQAVGELTKGTAIQMISGKFNNIKSWNPEWPNLYNMKISLKRGNEIIHTINERIGFRTVELRKHDGFYVNGEKVVFKGVNRHSFWPETGRALSEANHLTDIRLMKEMNMNAVRMSHYVPDKRFLELCDSLGLFVMNEVTGWQDSYDTIIGPKLVTETVLRDENHPCVVIWNHGNEGGWNFANETGFHKYDIQKRPVLYPWLLRNGMDTHHYPEYSFSVGRYVTGNDPFMATELLHGLYDGGLGAGLEDYWRHYETTPLHAGGFLWVFTDEAILRTDMEGTVYDADGNHAPDGILGPHRQKEGSFYTIKDIWSPVQVKPVTINRTWNGKLYLENKYIYTNLKECSFSWQAVKSAFGEVENEIKESGILPGPDAQPGETVALEITSEPAFEGADLFVLTATDHHGQELNTWSWPIIQPAEKASELIKMLAWDETDVVVAEDQSTVKAQAGDLEITFSKADGKLVSVVNSAGRLSLSGGPVPVGSESEVTGTRWETDEEGNFVFEISSKGYPEKMTWKVRKDGLLQLEATPMNGWIRDIDFIGISFKYPEEKCKAVTWMGRGPYRVWKNRIKGSIFGVWEKEYNNTITGESFNNLIYPEFKGYHGNLYWATLETTESPITIITETPNLFFQLYTPERPQHVAGGVYPPFPDGDLSFLYEIPAIGTKFKQPERLGPQSQKGVFGGRNGDQNYPIKLWFDLRGN
ncbi:MAG TPA: glycoside hydrolase family 2 TIM barrel-domain containing protein [Mariniphaga sp.]|nr:glycoside hydrolase family 2 TIM barrel-domain containing protein [Mariniphaga sp.]